MNLMVVTPQQIDLIGSLTDQARSIVIVCHMTPDGDALGSSLCLWHTLRHMGKNAYVVTPDSPPETLRFLPGADHITVASFHVERAKRLIESADLIFCMDFNDLKRIDRTAAAVEQSSGRRIVIDHHLNPSVEADVIVSHPEVSSTCALLYQVIEAMGWKECVNVDAAVCCCAGMMTDTGNFSYNSNDPRLYQILSELIAIGVDKDLLYTRLFNINSEGRIRIMGFAQAHRLQLFADRGVALITLSRADLDEFGYRRGDTEGLVNIPLSIPGIRCSIFLREDEPNYTKVSMRSKGEFSVKELTEKYFDGGGHKNAAGGELRAPLSEAVSRVLGIVSELPAPISEELKLN